MVRATLAVGNALLAVAVIVASGAPADAGVRTKKPHKPAAAFAACRLAKQYGAQPPVAGDTEAVLERESTKIVKTFHHRVPGSLQTSESGFEVIADTAGDVSAPSAAATTDTLKLYGYLVHDCYKAKYIALTPAQVAYVQSVAPVGVTTTTTSTTTTTTTTAPPPPPPPPPSLTPQTFAEIQNGMSYQQVMTILGSTGTLSAENSIGGINDQIYTWSNFGLFANVTFQNGVVIGKAQAGA